MSAVVNNWGLWCGQSDFEAKYALEMISEIIWKFEIFQIFISTVLSNLHSTNVIPHCTEGIPHCTKYPPQYWCYPSHVLMLSPICTDVNPHMYWCYPPMHWIPPQYWSYRPLYWTTSTVLKVSTYHLKLSSHMYCCYPLAPPPPQCWRYPSTVMMLSLQSTDVIPHSTDVIHSTEAIPHCTDVIPPTYWTISNVLSNLHDTEPTLYGILKSKKSRTSHGFYVSKNFSTFSKLCLKANQNWVEDKKVTLVDRLQQLDQLTPEMLIF